jgi:signal transduction histidine kinase
VRMAVRDNGGGFVPGGPRPSGGFGLTTMRERAQAMGGDLTIRSDPGQGTVVEVNLP